MFKLSFGFGAFFLYGSVGMASWDFDVQHATPSPMEISPWVPKGAEGMISEEERERRVKVCEREFEDCRDWCTRSKGGRDCYSKCSDKIGECMKQIPYADKN